MGRPGLAGAVIGVRPFLASWIPYELILSAAIRVIRGGFLFRRGWGVKRVHHGDTESTEEALRGEEVLPGFNRRWSPVLSVHPRCSPCLRGGPPPVCVNL